MKNSLLAGNDFSMSDTMKTEENRTLALAGVFQAASLVQQVAREGHAEPDAIRASIQSLFKIDATSVAEVYGGQQGVYFGLYRLKDLIASKNRSVTELEVTRYAVALLHLERKLAKRKDLINTIREGVEKASTQAHYFDSLMHQNVIASLADIYINTVSKLTPRIMVSGDPTYLNDPGKANLIRALLLAGIRSAVLWQQCGGSRLKLLFNRNRILQTASTLLTEA